MLCPTLDMLMGHWKADPGRFWNSNSTQIWQYHDYFVQNPHHHKPLPPSCSYLPFSDIMHYISYITDRWNKFLNFAIYSFKCRLHIFSSCKTYDISVKLRLCVKEVRKSLVIFSITNWHKGSQVWVIMNFTSCLWITVTQSHISLLIVLLYMNQIIQFVFCESYLHKAPQSMSE